MWVVTALLWVSASPDVGVAGRFFVRVFCVSSMVWVVQALSISSCSIVVDQSGCHCIWSWFIAFGAVYHYIGSCFIAFAVDWIAS